MAMRKTIPGLLVVFAACGGTGEIVVVDDPDAGQNDTGVIVVDAGTPDTGVVNPNQPPNTVKLSGKTLRLDAFLSSSDVPVAGTAINAQGAVGVAPVNSNALGDYEIYVPRDGQLILSASTPGPYLQSYEAVTVGAVDVERDFYIAYQPHVTRIDQAFGVDLNQTFACHPPNVGSCNYALVIGRVVDDGSAANGRPTPLAGVSANDFIVRGDGDPNWYKKGPYFFLFNGQPNPQGAATARARNNTTGYYDGGLFAIYVEIPQQGPGARTFEVAAASTAGGVQTRYFGPKAFTAYRGAFTWVELNETGVAVEPPPPPPPVDVDFATQVYPYFLPVAQGGLGCQGCHTNQGGEAPAGGLNLYGGPAAAFQGLNPAQYPARVNVANPGQSRLLTKPLFEPNGVQDHPIFAFLSDQDPAYATIYSWIAAGAPYDDNAPPPLEPVSFYNDVRPILYAAAAQGGAGCVGCHVTGVNANNAPGGAYFGGDGNALWQVITQQTAVDSANTGEPYLINRAGQPERSLLLTNPLVGSPEPHPAKLFNGVGDPRYQTIYRWIQEGYVNDTP